MITEQAILEILRGIPSNNGEDRLLRGCGVSVTINGCSVGVILDVHYYVDEQWEKNVKKSCASALKEYMPQLANITIVVVRKSNAAGSSRVKIPNVSNIILVVSGKGGVGKSTFATHLSLALTRLGKKSALVDADIYGPSIPRLLGSTARAEVDEKGQLKPIEMCGIKSISIGNIVHDESKAIIWRGPMLNKAIKNLMLGTNWGELDFMVIDTPPGTGDVHISLAKSFEVSGAVVVTTPHKLSVLQASRTCDMLRNLDTRLIGVVENMSYFLDHTTGLKSYIFGESCVCDMVKQEGTKLLGEVMVDPRICELSNDGSLDDIHDDLKRLYDEIACNILRELNGN